MNDSRAHSPVGEGSRVSRVDRCRPGRRALAMVIATVFGLAGLVIGAGSAVAGPVPPAATDTTVAGSGLVPVFDPNTGASGMATPDVAARIIAAYWTPARMAAATTVSEQAGPADADQKPEGAPHRVADPVAGRLRPSHVQVSFSNGDGRVFFHDPADGKDHACSGGAINSGKKRLVLTAGHCVHDGGGGSWMQNWAFFPGWESGPGAAGMFPAFTLTAQTAWTDHDNHAYDYAFVVTQNNANGGRLVDLVGGNGLIINPGRPFITFIGYPDNVANSQLQAFCQGQLSRKNIISADQQLNCNIGKGSSGGPWLQNYDNPFSGLGWAVSNTSYGVNPDPQGPVFGPYYGSDTGDLFSFAEGLSP